MIAEIEQHRAELEALCRRFGVRRLDLFGSAASGELPAEDSDIDFLVEFEPLSGQATPMDTSGCSRPWKRCSTGRSISSSSPQSRTPTSGNP